MTVTTPLKRAQIGKETTWGTSVTATAIVAEVTDLGLQIDQEIDRDERLGTLAPTTEAAEVSRAASFSLTQKASYEQLPYWLDSVFGIASPTGTAAPYTYSYSGPTTASPSSPRIFTIEYGDPSNIYDIAGALVESITVNIEQYKPWTVELNFIGKSAATGTFASLSDTSVNLIQGATLAIDSLGGTFGSTAISAALRSATWTYSNGRHLKFFADSQVPQSWGEGKPSSSLALTLEYTSDVKGYVDAMLSGAITKSIRISTGTSPTTAQLDFAGVVTGGAKLFEDADGNGIVTLNFDGLYDATNAVWCDWTILNSVSALP